MTKEELKKKSTEEKLKFLTSMINKMHAINQMLLKGFNDKLKRDGKLWAADLQWIEDMIDAIEEKDGK